MDMSIRFPHLGIYLPNVGKRYQSLDLILHIMELQLQSQ